MENIAKICMPIAIFTKELSRRLFNLIARLYIRIAIATPMAISHGLRVVRLHISRY